MEYLIPRTDVPSIAGVAGPGIRVSDSISIAGENRSQGRREGIMGPRGPGVEDVIRVMIDTPVTGGRLSELSR